MSEIEQAWHQFSDRLKAYAKSRLPNEQDAEDLVAEVFLRLHQGNPDNQRLEAWLFTVTRNLTNDFYRKRTNSNPLDQIDVPTKESFEVSETEAKVASWLRPMADSLPPKYGQALIMADFEGSSMKEIAAHLDISVSGAKSRVQRARKMLSDSLHQCCRFYFDQEGRVTQWERCVPKSPSSE